MTKLGMHWLRMHQDDARDLGHIAKMDYRSLTLYEPEWKNKDFCAALLATCPQETIFLLRDHPLSEQKQEMYSDPTGTAKKHSNSWSERRKQGGVFLPTTRCYHLGINEPDSNQFQSPINTYTEVFADEMGRSGMRIGGWQFGVGHPSTANLDPSKPPDWHWYESSYNALKRNSGIAVCHEYWMPNNYNWGNWCGRFIQHCPYDIQVVINECWIDSGVVGTFPSRGYRYYYDLGSTTTTDIALENLNYYQDRVGRDTRVHSVQPFCYDSNRDWFTFDTLPVSKRMEVYPWSASPAPKPPDPQQPVPVNGSFLRPCSGPRTQRFGENPKDYERFNIPGHNGVDYGIPTGTDVLAAEAGVVAFADVDLDYGNYIRIYHPTLNVFTFYAHLERVITPPGIAVKQGQPIAKSGNTGNSSGPHLHFEVRIAKDINTYAEGTYGYGKGRVDPEAYAFALNHKEWH
jgi:murein DD-endopeptidase MepM/ murein hydrolase activator NlpD